jgi:CheY-like chemotaxis protein
MTDESPKRRALVVEDYGDSADTLAALLGVLGFEPAVARDGLEALEISDRLRPDVVFLDIGLPKVNGYDVCRHIRRTDWGKNIVLIAVTGYGQKNDVKKSREAGLDAHLLKPVHGDDLVRAVEQAFQNGRSGALQPR